MALGIAALIFVLLMALISLYGYKTYVRPRQVLDQLAGHSANTLVATDEPGDGLVRALVSVGERVPVSPQDASAARRELTAAGYRSDTSVFVFQGLKVASCLAAFFGGLALHRHVSHSHILQILFVVMATGAGYVAPSFILGRIVDRRRERIRFGLPDALDLLVICVEAGQAMDQAIMSVARELSSARKDVADEFNLVTLEMRAGHRRMEALKNLANRTAEPDLRKLVGILMQTDRFGTSMSESLRSHSDFMRMKRMQEAEERANKVGVKLIFPIFFFVLPSMILVAAGPAIIQIFKVLLPLMRDIK